jgi:hypothetical protein
MKTINFIPALLALLILAATSRTSAQTFSLGAKAGAGISYFSNFDKGDYDIKRSPNIMVQGGLVAKLDLSKLVGIQFEILYHQNGEKYEMAVEPGLTTEMKLAINYITLPVLAEFSHAFGKVTLFGGLGPYFGYALNGKTTVLGTSEKIDFGKDNYRRFDVGASGDVGIGLKAGKGNIFLDFRYNYGFMDVMQVEDKPEGYKPHCTRNFGIYLGYMIPLGKSGK